MDAPSAIFAAAVALCALLGMASLLASSRRFAGGRFAAGTSHGVAALIFFLAAADAVLLGANLRAYERLTAERPVLRASFARAGDRQFNATLTYPSGAVQGYVLRGDEWQIDARVLKWRGMANVLGFDTIYRLERIGGRYADVERERTEPRTVYALHSPERLDAWALLRAWHDGVPWV